MAGTQLGNSQSPALPSADGRGSAASARQAGVGWRDCRRIGLACLAASGLARAAAQDQAPALANTSPYLPFEQREPVRYNLKWGRLTARLEGTLQAEYSDNINLSDLDPRSDVALTPQVAIGFLWPINERQVMQFDLGAGYRWYVDHPELNSVYVTPDSHLTLQLRMENVRVELRDDFQVQLDATSRRELSGTSESLIDFRRFSNVSALGATWQPTSSLTVNSEYSFLIDRSLSPEFEALDRNSHSVRISVLQAVNSRWTAGLLAVGTVFNHTLGVQNDGAGWMLAPTVAFQPTSFIQVDLWAGYSAMMFDDTGSIEDTSDFDGFTIEGSVRHRLNSRITHGLRLRRRPEIGFGSNYTDVFVVQYDLTARLPLAIQLNTHFVYETFETSGENSEQADRFLLGADTRLRVSRSWTVGLGYSFSWKMSELEQRDYSQNRLTLDIAHEF